MLSTRFNLFIALASLTLFACVKEENTNEERNENGTSLAKIITIAPVKDSTGFTFFQYNNQQKLVLIKDSFSIKGDLGNYVGLAWPYPIQYDAQGRVKTITYRNRLANDAVYDSLVYNNNEELPFKKVLVNELGRDTTISIYTYDSNNRLIKDSVFDKKNTAAINYTIYSYDNNNNLIEWNYFSNSSGALQNTKMQASYDNKKNPFKSFGIKNFPYRSVEQVLSTNNVVQKKYSDGTIINYEYQYFDTGLPKEARQTTISGSSSVVRTIEFYYE